MFPSSINKKLLPHKPGVYQFKDKAGRIIYVGKAIDLYHRVASYFSNAPKRAGDVKTVALVAEISSVETIIVESEIEALILEANLIKKYLPKFNVRLTDDKDYLYIGVTKDDLPKVIILRKQDLKKVKKYWGPFPSSRTVKDTLKSLRKVFPWCSNPPKLRAGFLDNEVIGKTRFRSCFYYHLGLCAGPCAGAIDKSDYLKVINRFAKFMDGKKEDLLQELTNEMVKLSEEQRFEEAGKVKRTIDGINYLTQNTKIKSYLENPNFLALQNQLALQQLQKDLDLAKIPERIECYDISNIQGHDATGSLVVLTGGEIDKSQYRKFKIHITGRPNDVGMHKEMMGRRLKHKEWPFPDLIIIDGGRGQARGAQFEILNFKFEIPVFGLAKRMEWLYPPEGEIIKLPKKSLSLRLLQKIRDEAHRFAITYHRKLHGKMIYR